MDEMKIEGIKFNTNLIYLVIDMKKKKKILYNFCRVEPWTSG